MATLNVVYRIAADLSNLQDGVAQTARATESLESGAKRLGGVLASAFSLNAIVSAAEGVGAYAGRIDDLAKKAGVSAQAMQELEFAAKQNGTTFDVVAQSIAQMSNRLVGGGKGPVEALERLNLSISDMRAMSPDMAFQAIGEQIAKLPDPMDQAAAAMAIFGKSGATLLPVLKSDLAAVREEAHRAGLVLSGDMVASGAKLGDTLEKLQSIWQPLLARVIIPMTPALETLATWIGVAAEKFGKLPQPVQAIVLGAGALIAILAPLAIGFTSIGSAIGIVLPLLTAALPAAIGSLGVLLGPAGLVVAGLVAVYVAFKNWDKIAAFAEAVYTGVKTWLVDKFAAVVRWIGEKVDAVTGFFRNMYDSVVGHSFVPDMVEGIGRSFGQLQGNMVTPARFAAQTVESIFSQLSERVGERLRDMSKSAQTAIGIGSAAAGGIGQAAGGGNAGQVASTASGMAGMVFAGSATGMAATAGSTAAMVTLGVATLGVGLAAAGTYIAIKKLLNDPEKKVNPLRQSFIDAAGGLEALNVHAHNAGKTLDRLLDAKNPKDYQSAIEELAAAFDFQDQALKRVSETAEKWNINTSLMGPIWDKQQLGKKAEELFQDWSVLSAAGIDQVEITQKMSSAVSDYLNRSKKLGLEIPESMRPMLEKFIFTGDLIDENGKKIDNLKGIKFAEPMSAGFDRVVSAVELLIKAIERGLNPAIASIPTNITTTVTTDHVDRYFEERHIGPRGFEAPEEHARGGIVGMSTGGIVPIYAAMGRLIPFTPRGTDTVPAMLTPGEMVINEPQQNFLERFIEAAARGAQQQTSGRERQPVAKNEFRIFIDGREIRATIQQDLNNGTLRVPERNIVRRAS